MQIEDEQDVEGQQAADRPRREVQDEAMIRALLGGATVEEAAAAGGRGRRAGYYRLKDPDFSDRLQKARGEALAAATVKAADAAEQMVDVLRELALNARSESVRRGAASDLLAHASSLNAGAAQEEQIASLEAEIAGLQRGWRG